MSNYRTWYIMSSTRVLFEKNKVTLAEVRDMWPGEGCVMVVERDGKKIFVFGAGDEKYGAVGDSIPYIQDTGHGYGASGTVKVENYVIYDIIDNISEKGNNIGLDEKRPVWVFK